MITHKLTVAYTEASQLSQLEDEDIKLLKEAWEACDSAYAPYSQFHVGAAVRLANDLIFKGNNQENAAYPSGLCAERTALFYAASQYPKVPITTIAVSTFNHQGSEFAKPCGACRQVMAEYEDLAGQPLRIILDGNDRFIILNGIDVLLPLRFKKEDLGK